MTLLLLLLALVINFFSSAWYAFVTYKLYSWFVVPLGAPALNWWHIWGLTMVFGAIVVPYTHKDSDDEDATAKLFVRIASLAITAAIMLLVGYIVKGQI